ncbi:MAG: amino acid permease, partial [Actinomycetota bacterium]|nr:amino acid permease [Actinomycetota bacterium]
AIPVFVVWALIAADVAAKIPLAGYAYQWTSRLNNPTLGWFTGFIALIAWVSGMTSLGYIFAGYLASVFNWQLTTVSQILIAILVVLVSTMINAYRVRLATLINNVGVGMEILITVGVTIVVGIVAFAIPDGHQPFSSLLTGKSPDSTTPYWVAWLGASLGPFFGLVGVEAVADVAEETKQARKVIPRTMFISLTISCVIEFLMYLVYVLAIKHPASIGTSAAPIEDIISQQLGPIFARIVVAFALTSIFVCLLANQLVGTRLLYSLSRDNMMPFSHVLRHVAPKRKTPSTSVLVLGAVSVLMLLSALVSAQTFNYFLGIATLAFFAVYTVQTIGLLIARRTGRIPAPEPGTFDLGRARVPVLIIGLVLFVLVDLALIFLPVFAGNAVVFAGVVALGAVWWLLVLRRRLKAGEAGPLFADTHPDVEPVVKI